MYPHTLRAFLPPASIPLNLFVLLRIRVLGKLKYIRGRGRKISKKTLVAEEEEGLITSGLRGGAKHMKWHKNVTAQVEEKEAPLIPTLSYFEHAGITAPLQVAHFRGANAS